MRINELITRVPKGSQKRAKHPQATDDPDKYVGKWEAYSTPQGIGSRKSKKVREDQEPQWRVGWQVPGQGDQPPTDGAVVVPAASKREAYHAVKRTLNAIFRDMKTKILYIDPVESVVEYMMGTVRFAPPDAITADAEFPTDERAIKRSRKAPGKLARKSAKALAGPLKPVLKPVQEAPEDYPPSNLNIDITNDEPVRKKAKPKPAHHVVDQNIQKMFPGMKPYVSETIRRPTYGVLNSDYEVTQGNRMVGKAKVVDGVIELLAVQEDAQEKFPGEVYSVLMGIIVREADRMNSNLSITIDDGEIHDFRAFMERFGFRRVGDNIMRRLAGSMVPPSVPLSRGLDGKD